MQYLNTTSEDALSYLINYNVFLTGPPGSGKSYLTKQYIDYCKKNKIKVGVGASTGIAGKILGGHTIHSLTGINVIYDNDEYKDVFDRVNSNYRKKLFWKKTQALIIDEISLLDKKTFSFLDKIGRDIRGVDKPFGGIRLLVVGDFFQLPPVNGDYAFKYDEWDNCFHYAINLTNIYRSKDDNLTKILQRIRKGKELKDWMIDLLKCCESDTDIYPVLVPKKNMANSINRTNLKKNVYEPIKIEANYYFDEKKAYLKNTIKKMCNMCDELVLKRGCPLMMLVNDKSKGLVNGQIGTFIKIEDGNIFVEFNECKYKIKRHMWSYTTVNGDLISMEQYPLMLCYSITIHKSQGQSLSQASIVLDTNVWEKGQGYVALSRLESLEGLHLKKFNPYIFKVDKTVKKYYKKFKE